MKCFAASAPTINLPEEEPAPPTPETPPRESVTPRNTATEDAPVSVSAVSATEDGDEESIDEYMNRLMQRVRRVRAQSQGSVRTRRNARSRFALCTRRLRA